jgi:2-phospho-L-lactate guanylyltransferase
LVLARVLELAAPHPVSFLSDAAGSGTTVYAALSPADFAPAYGPESAARHRAAGAVSLDGAGLAAVRRDVDTPEDLAAAKALGVGPRTRQVLGEIGPELKQPVADDRSPG